MNKFKNCLQDIKRINLNKKGQLKLVLDKPKLQSLLNIACFSFADSFNAKNKNIKSGNSLRDKLNNKNNLDNILNIKRHEQKSNFNKDQYNRVKIDPNDESFYGLPISQSIPKNEEDLIEKFTYLQNVDDFIDLYAVAENHFSPNSLTKFLEKLFYIHLKEMRKLVQKGKEQNFVFKSETVIKSECENKIEIFLEKINANLIAKKESFSNKELMNIAFELVYRYKKFPSQEIVNAIKNIIKYEELKNMDKNYNKNDLIKFSFILTKYEVLKITEEEAQKTYDDLADSLIKLGLEKLTIDEIKTIIFNFTKNKFPVNVELFTLLEPYIIKEINSFDFKSLAHVFNSYLKHLRGSDFYIKTIGFHLGARIKEATITEISILMNVSHSKYFKRDDLTCKFEDFFPHKLLVDKIIGSVNEIQKIHFFSIIPGLINLGNADRKIFQVLSTILLRISDKMKFEELIILTFFFTLVDYENATFYTKIIDVIKLHMMCIKNFLDGNENMKNLIGLIDTKLVDKLDNEDFTWKLKNFKSIQNNPTAIKDVMNNLTKLIWILSFSSIKHIEGFNISSLSELIKDSVLLFNNFVGDINESVLNNYENESNQKVFITKENLNLILLSYVYLNNDQNFSNMKIPNVNKDKSSQANKTENENKPNKFKSLNPKKESIKPDKNTTPMFSNNLNIEFLKQINIIDYDSINYIDYKKFIIFAKLIEFNLAQRSKILESDTNTIKAKNFFKFHINLDASITNENEIENFDFFKDKFKGIQNIDKDIFYLLDPTYLSKNIINGNLTQQLIFVNQCYEYFKISDSVSGKIKIRRELCKRLKINFIEYDFYEFLNYSNLRESDFQLTQDNFEDYSEKIDEYITVKNEVYSK